MKNSRKICFRSALCALLLSAGSLAASAQDATTASISGTVTDATGATIRGAVVTLTNTDTGEVARTLTTNGAGFYTAAALPLGTYNVAVTNPGFGEQDFQHIVLHANETLTLNGTLKPGATESVSVTEAAQMVNLEAATQETVIDGTQVRELVTATRNYESLVGLQPGVAYTGGDQIYIGNSSPVGGTNVVNFSVNGARTSGNSWTVDGADNVDRGSNFTLLTYPSIDAIKEFTTLRGTYSAQYGRSASGQVNVITRNGTKDFHGTLYEFVRNNVFNANSVLNKLTTTPSGAAKSTSPRSVLRYNDFGGTVGGPVWIPRVYDGRNHGTFFFYSQEVRRVILYNPITLFGVPSLAERQGNFTNPVCTYQTTYVPGGPGTTSKNQGSCQNAGTTTVNITSTLAKEYLKDIYANVGAPDATGTLVLAPQRNIYNGNQQIGRIDQDFGQKGHAFFRIINDSIPTIEPGGLFQGSGYPGVNTTSTNAPGRIYLGHATWTFTPNLLLEGGYAFSKGALLSDPIGTMLNANSPDIKPTLLYPTTLPRVPAINASPGISWTGLATYGPYRDYNRNHNAFADVILNLHTHTLRVGADFNHYNKTENNAAANAGTFTFGAGNLPSGTTAQTYQQAWANFLTGYVNTFSQASVDVTPSVTANQIEFFVQDDWKATPRLTINAGIRYSYFGQPYDANHELTTFDPSLYNPALAPTIDTGGAICVVGAPCAGGTQPNGTVTLQQAITNGISVNGKLVGTQANGTTVFGTNSPYGDQVSSADKLNFAPRFGFAYDVFGNGRTSVRGGFGISYDSSLFGTYEQNIFQNPPFIFSPSVSNTNFDNPGAVSANVSYSAQLIRATSPHFHTPYDEQYSLSVQSQLPGKWFGEVAYVGSSQVHLLGLVDINQAAPGAFAALSPGVTVTSGNTVQVNRVRPYKGFQAINSVQTIFSGNYNSLQVSTSRKFARGSQVTANYTYSKALTNAAADRSGAPQISSRPDLEYGRASADRRNMFNANAVYAVPFFYEQQGLIGRVLGGWEVSAIVFANSGLPLNPTTSGLDPAGVGFLGSSAAGGRPDLVGNPNADNPNYAIHTRQHWFNVNAYTAVPAGQIRGGNAQRNSVEGPGWWRADLGLFKNIRFYERLNLQLRGEAYNVLNHTNPDGIATGGIVNGYNATTGVTTYSSTAGNITSYRDKRILQLGAKLTF